MSFRATWFPAGRWRAPGQILRNLQYPYSGLGEAILYPARWAPRRPRTFQVFRGRIHGRENARQDCRSATELRLGQGRIEQPRVWPGPAPARPSRPPRRRWPLSRSGHPCSRLGSGQPQPHSWLTLQSCGFSDVDRPRKTWNWCAVAWRPPGWKKPLPLPIPIAPWIDSAICRLRASTGLETMLREDRQLLTIWRPCLAPASGLSRHLLTHPATWPNLLSGPGDPRPDPVEWQARLPTRLAGADYEEALREMRRFQAEKSCAFGFHDVAGNLAHEEVSAQLGRLAEACLAQAVNRVAAELEARLGRPDAELTILVLGSWARARCATAQTWSWFSSTNTEARLLQGSTIRTGSRRLASG